MLEFQCPACGAKLRAPDDKRGKKGSCKHCTSEISVPEEARKIPDPAVAEVAQSAPDTVAFPVTRAEVEDLLKMQRLSLQALDQIRRDARAGWGCLLVFLLFMLFGLFMMTID